MEDDFIPADPSDPQPIYPGYAAHFRTSAAAKAYRKSIRVPAKKLAPDVERVIRFGRRYWVRRLYDSMIDVSDISDSKSSIHRHRFQTASAKTFKDQDLEATAHHIFDVSIAVHTRGWNRPETYYKKAVRGKLVDHSEKSLELRLNKICECLKRRKATVDDAIRSGVTLALLCDNPWARGSTKESNNNGNKKRGQRLAMAKEQALRKEQEEALRQGRGQEEQEEAEQEEAEEEAEQEEDEQDVSDDGEE
ncbi:hypothetical protein T440DRAFT_383038 [Plenodomus tracheiphilus IPT5]|uniref:Uncharacterized protein n=1 Tax=Plenodomus tracheiphilus IPT5 TaxID=1408161 RepID=A0A6A7BME0_9PLEO|nr:hypothetical protein T440DRAFT_383038 [Plenodomus tracheiphilus IPT5]